MRIPTITPVAARTREAKFLHYEEFGKEKSHGREREKS